MSDRRLLLRSTVFAAGVTGLAALASLRFTGLAQTVVFCSPVALAPAGAAVWVCRRDPRRRKDGGSIG